MLKVADLWGGGVAYLVSQSWHHFCTAPNKYRPTYDSPTTCFHRVREYLVENNLVSRLLLNSHFYALVFLNNSKVELLEAYKLSQSGTEPKINAIYFAGDCTCNRPTWIWNRRMNLEGTQLTMSYYDFKPFNYKERGRKTVQNWRILLYSLTVFIPFFFKKFFFVFSNDESDVTFE